MHDFSGLISEKLTQILQAHGITAPTAIQMGAIPVIAAGRDLMAQSATGTGKTLAYLLPIFDRINPEIKGCQAVVIAPTYELAAQIAKVAAGLADKPSDVALLIGSASKTRQHDVLKAKPKVVIGSIQRILEHRADKKLSLHNTRTLVFDEADRLFVPETMPFIEQLVKATLRERQILLFSASLPDGIINKAMPLTKQAEVLRIDDKLPQNIRHYYITAQGREKFDTLRKLMHALDMPQAIAFVNAPFAIEKVAARLNHHKLAAMPLFGAAQAADRKAAMEAFRAGRTQMLVASDVGSRGLDVPELRYVFNLDLPSNEKDYLHRAGRCGRMGRDGVVVSIVTAGEAAVLKKFAAKLSVEVFEATISHGKFAERGV